MSLPFDEKKWAAMMLLAGIETVGSEHLPNGYWPEVYEEVRRSSPWFLIFTDFGPVKIGWRKRVLSISWEHTKVRAIVTQDDVSKSNTDVHAWTYAKAVEYLTALREAAEEMGVSNG